MYEEIRHQNIARNKEILKALGFHTEVIKASSTPIHKPTKRKLKTHDNEPVKGTRSSKRLKKDYSEIVFKETPQKDNEVSVNYSLGAHLTLKYFRQEKPRIHDSSLMWDGRKMHQHLQISRSKRTVATTGCAGYGAILACSQKSEGYIIVGKKPSSSGTAVRWSIEVLTEGTGGFAVGVCLANAKGPFKSMGNRPDSWVLHSSGNLLHNRTSVSLKSCQNGYSAGDTIDIILTSEGELEFKICEKEIYANIVVPSGKYTLCCQPYMGGVGRII